MFTSSKCPLFFVYCSIIRNYIAESASRDDIKSAKEVAQIFMGNPKAMQSKTGTPFSLNRLNDILANGSLSDINRMNNALAKNIRDNGENPYKVIKGIPNRRIEPQPANVANVQKGVQDKSETPKPLNDFLNTISNKMVRRTHENTLSAKCKYKGQNMSKANRVEKMAANGERFEQRGKKFFGVTSEGDFKATMGEYNYYKYLTQRKKETNAQTAPKEAKQEQNTKPVNKPVQQEENSADTVEENTPAYGSDVAENVARMANGGNREAWIDRNYHTESGKPINEAEKQEFIVKPNGDKNFGEISQEIETKTNGVVKAAPIRLQVGNEHFGYIHLLKHAEQIKQKGYDIMSYINHILNNFTQIYSQQTANKPNRFVLYCNDKSKGFMPIDLEFEQNSKGYYTIVSLMPHRAKIKGTLLFDGSANPSTATADGTLLDESSKNGGAATSPNTHEKSNVPSTTSTVPQNQQNVKEKKSIIIGGEKYYIADTPIEPSSNSKKKKKSESHTNVEKPVNAKENPNTVTVNGETFYFEKPSGAGLPLAMYGNKKSHFGKGAEKKKTIYHANRQQYGNEVEVRTDDGKPIKTHYALIPADKLIASNKADDTLSKNEAYPQDLQPRDRQRTAMRLQVDSMANNLRPEDLADSRNLNQGAPIVRSDLTVLNGNGRTLAIQRAYQTGKAEEYKQYLLDNAEKLGLRKSQVAEMVKGRDVLNTKKGKYERAKSSQPILVRVVDDLSEGDTQSVINSTTGGQRMGSTEQAKADSKKIKSDTLRKYTENNKGDLTTTANEEFLGDVLKDIVPVNERNAYLTKDGKINKDGLARAERALFSRAYGDESLLEDFGENLNEEARNMTNALRANAPAIARLQQKIKEGNAHNIGLQKNLVEAVKAIKSAIKQNKPAQSIWEEQTMIDDTAYSPETIEIAKVLHDLRRSSRKLSAFMGKLADLNEQHGNPKDEDLFSGEELAEPSLMNDIPIANQYAEELTRAKYSRDAENQLDNQGEKADNEDEVFTDYAELEKLAQAEKDKKEYGYYSKIKDRVDKLIGRDIGVLFDKIAQNVCNKFIENIGDTTGQIDTHVLRGDKRKTKVLNTWATYASKFVEKPSNYKEVLTRFVPGYKLDNLKREEIIYDYNLYRNVAREMYEYGSYVYGELCEELARGEIKQYNSRDREHVGRSIRGDLNRVLERTRVLGRSKKSIKFLTEMYGRQALENLKIPKHSHENQNSRDVSAFSFAGNPLSEEALKAKAEFETPLDELEKVSRERLRKVERNIQDFGKRIGVPVHFVYHPDRGYRGVCIHNGGIYINLNSNVPARRIFMHEFVHWLKASGKDISSCCYSFRLQPWFYEVIYAS